MTPEELEAAVRKGDEKIGARLAAISDEQRRALVPTVIRLQKPGLFHRSGDVVGRTRRVLAARNLATRISPAVLLAFRDESGDRGDGPLDRVLVERDPHFLKTHLWILFEPGYERVLPIQDAGGPRRSPLREEQRWSYALPALAARGHVDRERLLQETLAALARPMGPLEAEWFCLVLDKLAPTAEEQARYAAQYIRILGGGAFVAPLARKTLNVLLTSGRLDALAIARAVPDIVRSARKAETLKLIALLRRVAGESSPEARTAFAHCAAVALDRKEQEVQTRAFALIETAGSPSDDVLIGLIAEHGRHVAPAIAQALAAWMGAPPKVEAITTTTIHPARLVPPQSLDEVLALVSGLLERLDSAEDLELALDGIGRFGADRPADFELRAGPLLKRATELPKDLIGPSSTGAPFRTIAVTLNLCAVVRCWIDRRTPPPVQVFSKLGSFLAVRMHEVARRASEGQAVEFLAAPTHTGGWIDPQELVQRGLLPGAKPLRDSIQALLRISRQGRDEALRRMPEMTGEFGGALRYALGGPLDESAIKNPPLWLAAARTRSPRDAIPFVTIDGPDGSQPASYTIVRGQPNISPARFLRDRGPWAGLYVTTLPPFPGPPSVTDRLLRTPPNKEVPVDHVTVLLHNEGEPWTLWEMSAVSRSLSLDVRHLATVWPQNFDPFFAAGLRRLSDNLEWRREIWSNRCYLEPLLRADVPVERLGRLVLATGLGAGEAGEVGLASEALVQTLADGRMTGEALGEAMAELLGFGLIQPPRWTRSLGEVARVWPQLAGALRDAIQRALRGVPETLPRDLGALLELLNDLCVKTDARVNDPEAIAVLRRITVGGKTGKAVRALLTRSA